MNGARILFALPVVGQPRHSKRIAMLFGQGFSGEAIAFERNYHKGRIPGCPITCVGRIDQGRYLSRALKVLAALPKTRRAMRDHDFVYAFGPDMALMCLISGFGLGRPIVMEIGDIREMQLATGLKGRLTRALDKVITQSTQLLVGTTQSFIDGYYRQRLNCTTPSIVIENKLEDPGPDAGNEASATPEQNGLPLRDRPLRIGYFGLLRWENSWRILKTLALARPHDLEIFVAGHVIEPVDLPQQAEEHSNIFYLGEYSSPDDLPSLYNSVDLIWVVYPDIGPDDWNLKWARTNRFYESCFFRTPIISRAGCSDAEEVKRFGIGLVIDEQEVERVVQILCTIDIEDILTWRENMKKVPRHVFVYTTEAENLARVLCSIAAGHAVHSGKIGSARRPLRR